ncbi:MAG TPA: response regulator transcription factor [Candidatus Acidoferrum sp.]|nr:response regulator transcription factor [Candidatus Acidoferrum sp.]
MSASARRSLATDTAVRSARPNGATRAARNHLEGKPGSDAGGESAAKLSVFVAADNRLLREALARMLTKKGNIEVTGLESAAPPQAESVAQTNADVLLLTSRGALNDDLLMIQQVRAAAPGVRILLLGMAKNSGEFLQCVRAGISGYLLHDASSDEVLEGVGAVHAGEAVCPGKLCTALFRYFESEGASLPCASARRRWGLTRREQQLVPLVARGLTNKEIANHFSLSEQTVKNHLYRMKQKTGAEDRLDIVQLYRTQGFLV